MTVDTLVSVNSLRSAGLRVKVNHHRKYRRYENGKIHVDLLPNSVADVRYALPRGGKVEVTILDPQGNEYVGISRCADTDSYNKKIGVQLAITEALRKLLVAKTK